MKNSSMMLFFTMTVLSVILIINSNNWMSLWMGLEINMMAFISLIAKSKDHLISESMMMYFLVQSMGSVMVLLMIILNNSLMFYSMASTMTMNVLMMGMCIKLGVPPFHSWFPEMMSKLNWIKGLMLMTWQKIAPMFIMASCMSNLLMLFIILSVLAGALGGLNHTSLRKLIAYSSINHMGWMISCLYFNSNLWMMYLTIYTIMMTPLTVWMHYNKIYFMNQASVMTKTLTEKMVLSLNMLSMGGLPPFIGFYPKWMIIQSMMENGSKIIIIIMVMCSLLTLLYYMRMLTSMFMMNNYMNKWMIKNKNNKTMKMMFLINMMLPLGMYMFTF
uniref:NADH-ubiquinone oxidoreductase chain 2 n=1 Tax=Gorpis humeralis TaxID=1041165 RepID=K7NBC5_9HEMI|nr:NADH dehydrogenase subunit 2 [Gorpis humeralis]AEH21200.1 NADH dehydrogenase subunit 2 [Gorpis humeralis]